MKLVGCQMEEVHKDVPRALAAIQACLSSAGNADLVCFPECFLQGYEVDAQHVREVALDLNSSAFVDILGCLGKFEPFVVLGLIERDQDAFFNTAVAIRRGELVARYRKIHLLPGERSIFTPGEDYPVFEVAGMKVGINICHDLNFSEAIQAVARQGAGLVVCPCNNMLSRDRAEEWKHRHHEVRVERAREAGVWLLSSDVTGTRGDRIAYGPTSVIAPDGSVLDQVPLMEAGMITIELEVSHPRS